MKLNMVNGKSVGDFSNQVTQGSASNKNIIREQKFPSTLSVILSDFH
jgi:hypothetical protein